MKKWKIILIGIITLLFLPFCIVLYNSLSLNYALNSTYTKSTYNMPSTELKGEIYVDNQITDKIDTSIISTCLQDNEQFLEMQFNEPIKIIVCKDDVESARIFHYFKTKGSGFAFSDNLIIVNYRNLYDLGYTYESIIRHESSHTLVKQNIDSFITMIWRFSNNSLWFSEGIALYNQGLVIYSDDELKSALNGYEIQYSKSLDNFYTVPQNYRNDYSVYYYFMKYLIEKYGQQKIIDYSILMIKDYSKSSENFYAIFNTDIQSELSIFCLTFLQKKLL